MGGWSQTLCPPGTIAIGMETGLVKVDLDRVDHCSKSSSLKGFSSHGYHVMSPTIPNKTNQSCIPMKYQEIPGVSKYLRKCARSTIVRLPILVRVMSHLPTYEPSSGIAT